MASDQQVALTRRTGPGTSNLNKSTRQVVPAFLQKLYEMVNDPNNNDLIRWSEAGDSFFVLDHERFAREVLGRWFKHQNFSSFVRQLNMYGFHKIPHLQQGVLKSDTETEFWNFEHPNFRRSQPDLLCLIQRKKQAQIAGSPGIGGEDPLHPIDGKEPTAADTAAAATAAAAALSSGQLLDINTVLSGIAVIKRHQSAISSDLNELKTSNQQLWQEALAARERHKKQQDTINRILKFLAGVFGQGGMSGKHREDGHSPPGMIPRKNQRLMIASGGDGKPFAKARAVEIVDVEDEEAGGPRTSSERDRDQTPVQYAHIESPQSTTSALPHADLVSPAPSDLSSTYGPDMSIRSGPTTPGMQDGYTGEMRPNGLSSSMGNTPYPIFDGARAGSSSKTPDGRVHEPAYPMQPAQGSASTLSPSSLNSITTVANGHRRTPSPNSDATMQHAFQQIINSPVQMQKFLQTLANNNQSLPFPFQPSMAPNVPPPPNVPVAQPHYTYPPSFAQITPYDSSVPDRPNGYHIDPQNIPQMGHTQGIYHPQPQPLQLLYPPSENEHVPPPPDNTGIIEPLSDNSRRLNRTYNDASEIDADVDALQTSIYSLIENLGLDPDMINQQIAQGQADGHGQRAGMASGPSPHPPTPHPLQNGHSHQTRLDHMSMPPPSMTPGFGPDAHGASSDFDIDAFLTEFSRDGDASGDYGDFADKFTNQTDGNFSAFLDEVASNASDPPPVSPAGTVPQSPELRPTKAPPAQKRKSEVFLGGEENSLHGSQAKRKR